MDVADAKLVEYRESCDSGDAVGCVRRGNLARELAGVRFQDQSVYAEEAATAYRRGCDLGLRAACDFMGLWDGVS